MGLRKIIEEDVNEINEMFQILGIKKNKKLKDINIEEMFNKFVENNLSKWK